MIGIGRFVETKRGSAELLCGRGIGGPAREAKDTCSTGEDAANAANRKRKKAIASLEAKTIAANPYTGTETARVLP